MNLIGTQRGIPKKNNWASHASSLGNLVLSNQTHLDIIDIYSTRFLSKMAKWWEINILVSLRISFIFAESQNLKEKTRVQSAMHCPTSISRLVVGRMHLEISFIVSLELKAQSLQRNLFIFRQSQDIEVCRVFCSEPNDLILMGNNFPSLTFLFLETMLETS